VAYTSFAELLAAAGEHGSLGRAVIARESDDAGAPAADLVARMDASLVVMREAIESGSSGQAHSRSGLVGGDARRLTESAAGPVGGLFSEALAAALATAEVNASMGRIVAAPTGGASGVLPGVLLTLAERCECDDEALVEALFAAAGIGAIIAARATLAGAMGGCQAEIGSGAAMAAAAAVELCGGTPRQAGHAASFALQGLLGLVCDPVGGLVEVPCVARNATGAAVSLAGIEMALAGMEFPIPFDEVVDAAAHVGRSLPASLRETARGGLAATPTGQTLAEKANS